MTLPMLSPRRRRAAFAAAASVAALAAALPASALAIPPGGPGETRNGATVTVSPRLVAPGGTVTIAGSGFSPGQTLNVKLDDGLLLPATPAPGGADVFLTVVVDGSGNIPAATDLDLDTVRPADQPAVQDGSHRVRVLSGSPVARSIHADFAVTTLSLGPPENLVGSGPPPPVPASGFVGPPESELLEFPAAADPDLPYTDIPRLVAGSVVPFRFHDFPAAQLVTLKRNDAAANELQLMSDASGDGAGYVTPDTTQPGSNWIRFLTGPPPNQRSVRAPYAIVPNTDGRGVKITRQVLASGSVAYATKALTRQPVDYVPLSNDGQTFRAQIQGEAPITQTANGAGVATGTLALPPGILPGTYTALFTIGFAKQNDFPQAVFARSFDVVAELPAATAALASATSLPGGTVSYTLGSFASNAGGGQKVGVYVDGVAAPVDCVDTRCRRRPRRLVRAARRRRGRRCDRALRRRQPVRHRRRDHAAAGARRRRSADGRRRARAPARGGLASGGPAATAGRAQVDPALGALEEPAREQGRHDHAQPEARVGAREHGDHDQDAEAREAQEELEEQEGRHDREALVHLHAGGREPVGQAHAHEGRQDAAQAPEDRPRPDLRHACRWQGRHEKRTAEPLTLARAAGRDVRSA